jgi:hypothetical protein
MRIHGIHLIALTVASSIVSLLPSTAKAQDRLRGVVRLGLEHGGDRVVSFTYEDGSTPKVTAGGGVLVTLGGAAQLVSFGAHALDAQLNMGVKWRTIPPATNQDANWLRFPVEGLLFYRTPLGLRFGAGGTVHLRNVLQASGEVLNDRVAFRNTPGLLLQADYLRGNLAFDLRYTAMKYETESSRSETVDASSIGVGMSFFFGRSARAAAPRGASSSR